MSSIRKTSFGNRKFYALPEEYAVRSSKFKSVSKKEDVTKLIKYIDDSVIGKNTSFTGPYGRRKGNFPSFSLDFRFWRLDPFQSGVPGFICNLEKLENLE
ncbi:hypothetical protein M8J77_013820 [Diaphorina citri]|jgi:hypothetical protein|nr:hypothetical protein M8J77_013820 [Diaphorina citri]